MPLKTSCARFVGQGEARYSVPRTTGRAVKNACTWRPMNNRKYCVNDQGGTNAHDPSRADGAAARCIAGDGTSTRKTHGPTRLVRRDAEKVAIVEEPNEPLRTNTVRNASRIHLFARIAPRARFSCKRTAGRLLPNYDPNNNRDGRARTDDYVGCKPM